MCVHFVSMGTHLHEKLHWAPVMPRVREFANEVLGKDVASALTLPCESVERFLKEFDTIKSQGNYGISEQVSFI